MVYSEKLPPHDSEAEIAVIGSLLIDGTTLASVASFLEPADFYHERNRFAYEAALALFRRDEPVDQVTIATELRRANRLDEIGGAAYLAHCISVTPNAVHIEHYARIVVRMAMYRALITAAGEIANLAYEGGDDPDAAITRSEELLYRLHRVKQGSGMTLREAVDAYMEEQAEIYERPAQRSKSPVPTGFADIDNVLGRLERGGLYVVAARPSHGKSTLAVNIAYNAARAGYRVLVFSLEMSTRQILHMLLSNAADVDHHLLRLGLLGQAAETRVMDALGELSELPMSIEDGRWQTPLTLRSEAFKWHGQAPLDLVIVDYLQLVEGTGRRDGRVQELSEITRQLKALAGDLNVPVIALSQLSRAVEQRPDHHPQLSDLRESGSIEQDADVVMFIHRPDKYFSEEQWEKAHGDEPYPENLAQLIIAKNRFGPTRTVYLYARMGYSRFETLQAETKEETR